MFLASVCRLVVSPGLINTAPNQYLNGRLCLPFHCPQVINKRLPTRAEEVVWLSRTAIRWMDCLRARCCCLPHRMLIYCVPRVLRACFGTGKQEASARSRVRCAGSAVVQLARGSKRHILPLCTPSQGAKGARWLTGTSTKQVLFRLLRRFRVFRPMFVLPVSDDNDYIAVRDFRTHRRDKTITCL